MEEMEEEEEEGDDKGGPGSFWQLTEKTTQRMRLPILYPTWYSYSFLSCTPHHTGPTKDETLKFHEGK